MQQEVQHIVKFNSDYILYEETGDHFSYLMGATVYYPDNSTMELI